MMTTLASFRTRFVLFLPGKFAMTLSHARAHGLLQVALGSVAPGTASHEELFAHRSVRLVDG
jgi:hypothetical protein